MPAPEVLSAASLRSAFRRHGKVIFRSDGYSVVKDRRERMPSIFFGQRGGKIHPCCRKKYSVFSAGSDILHHIQKPPSFLNPLNEKTLIFLSRRIKNKARKRNCSNVPKNIWTKEKVFSRSRGKDLFRRASYPSNKKRRGSKMIQSSRIILTRTALCSPTINGTALVRIENDTVIP